MDNEDESTKDTIRNSEVYRELGSWNEVQGGSLIFICFLFFF